MVSTKTRPPASRAPEDGTTAPELARLGHDPACHPRASSATRVSLTPASASGASRRGPLRALGRGARRRLQKTRLYQLVPPVTFPSPERSTRQGHPQQPPDPPSHVAHPSGHEPPEAPERRGSSLHPRSTPRTPRSHTGQMSISQGRVHAVLTSRRVPIYGRRGRAATTENRKSGYPYVGAVASTNTVSMEMMPRVTRWARHPDDHHDDGPR